MNDGNVIKRSRGVRVDRCGRGRIRNGKSIGPCPLNLRVINTCKVVQTNVRGRGGKISRDIGQATGVPSNIVVGAHNQGTATNWPKIDCGGTNIGLPSTSKLSGSSNVVQTNTRGRGGKISRDIGQATGGPSNIVVGAHNQATATNLPKIDCGGTNIGLPSTSKLSGSSNVVQTNTRGKGAKSRGAVRGRRTGVNGSSVIEQYSQATSTNLPKMDFLKVAEYFQLLRSPELRQAKDSFSARADYGDNAVGYVRVKRDHSICKVEARFTPETSVNETPYMVSVRINEDSNSIVDAACNCQASAGECKHQTAMIFWLLRRSEEPAPTEIACYWRKSVLSTVKGLKAKTTDELCKRCTDFTNTDDSLLRAFIERGKESNKTAFVIKYSECRTKKSLYIDHLVIHFLEAHSELQFSCENFLTYCSQEMTTNLCHKVFEETMDQAMKPEWYYQRFARITASKLYECSKRGTPDGSLVAAIMGARSFKGTSATKRGQKLENEVFQILKAKYPSIKKCGVVLKGEFPIFAASPDGITDDTIFEIKCPYTEGTINSYIDEGVVKPKVFFQIQLQLLMTNRTKGIMVVADPQKKTEELKKLRLSWTKRN